MISDERFETTVKMLLKMIVSARREAAIAQTYALRAQPEVQPETLREIRQKISQDYDELLRSIDEKPVRDALEWLHNFEGTVQ